MNCPTPPMLERLFKLKENGTMVRTEIVAGVEAGGRTGLAFGFISYPLLKLFVGRGKGVSPLVYALGIIFLLRYILL